MERLALGAVAASIEFCIEQLQTAASHAVGRFILFTVNEL